MSYYNSVITDAGAALLTKATANGGEINVISAAIGTGSTADSPEALTALVSPASGGAVLLNDKYISQGSPTTLIFPVEVSNIGLTEEIPIREIGIFAQDDTSTILFAYSWYVGEDGNNILPIPQDAETADAVHSFDIGVFVTNQQAAMINVTVSDAAYVTAERLAEYAVNKGGDTMKGDLWVKKNYPRIMLQSETANRMLRTILFDNINSAEISNYADESNYLGLRIARETDTLKSALKLVLAKNGAFSEYNIYGAHNKPTAADVGAMPVINANAATYNMDDVIKSGAHLAVYITGGNTLGTPQKHGRTALASAAILNYGNEADYGVQVAFMSGGGIMTRSLTKGILSDWASVYHEGNAAAVVATAELV